MQRLTYRAGGTVCYIGRYSNAVAGVPDTPATMKKAATKEVLQRLADYEDCGRVPEEIQRPALPCPYCSDEIMACEQYHAIKTPTGKWVAENELRFCWNCGRKL